MDLNYPNVLWSEFLLNDFVYLPESLFDPRARPALPVRLVEQDYQLIFLLKRANTGVYGARFSMVIPSVHYTRHIGRDFLLDKISGQQRMMRFEKS